MTERDSDVQTVSSLLHAWPGRHLQEVLGLSFKDLEPPSLKSALPSKDINQTYIIQYTWKTGTQEEP